MDESTIPFNVMGIKLSFFKDNYQNIVLYTDSHGYEIFAEQLKLPYTDIIIQYDNLTCPEPHWAYPKLLTYSLQKNPSYM